MAVRPCCIATVDSSLWNAEHVGRRVLHHLFHGRQRLQARLAVDRHLPVLVVPVPAVGAEIVREVVLEAVTRLQGHGRPVLLLVGLGQRLGRGDPLVHRRGRLEAGRVEEVFPVEEEHRDGEVGHAVDLALVRADVTDQGGVDVVPLDRLAVLGDHRVERHEPPALREGRQEGVGRHDVVRRRPLRQVDLHLLERLVEGDQLRFELDPGILAHLLGPELEHREAVTDVPHGRIGRPGSRRGAPPDRRRQGSGQQDHRKHEESAAPRSQSPNHDRAAFLPAAVAWQAETRCDISLQMAREAARPDPEPNVTS